MTKSKWGRTPHKPEKGAEAVKLTEEQRKAIAAIALRPETQMADVLTRYSESLGEQDFIALTDALHESGARARAGNTEEAEAMLLGQAHALQAIFAKLSIRAGKQEYLKQWDALLRMALKAQNQCRMTLETLAAIKNPTMVYARQANINNGGQQQVVNGGPTPAPRSAANWKPAPIKLLEASHGERLDTGTPGKAGGADPELEAVAAIHRPAQR